MYKQSIQKRAVYMSQLSQHSTDRSVRGQELSSRSKSEKQKQEGNAVLQKRGLGSGYCVIINLGKRHLKLMKCHSHIKTSEISIT